MDRRPAPTWRADSPECCDLDAIGRQAVGDVRTNARRVGESGAALPENATWLDPVYTHAALRSLADLHLQGLAVAAAFAHAGVLGLGLLIVRRGLRRRPWLLWLGVAVQVQVALGILGAPPSLRDLEATRMSFAANAMAPWLAPRGQAMTDVAAGVWPPLLSAIFVGLALMVGYLPSALTLVLREDRGQLADVGHAERTVGV